MERSILLSWVIPEHASIDIEHTRKQLFSHTGCISLRSLEPMIPIGYIPERIGRDDFPDDIPKPDPIILDTMTIHEHTLFLTGVDTVHLSDTQIHYSVSGEYPIPPFFGIFLGSGDVCSYLEAHRPYFDQVKKSLKVKIAPAHIQQVQLYYWDPQSWWNDISYTAEKIKSLQKPPAETESD